MDKNIFLAKNPWKRGGSLPEPELIRPEFEQVPSMLSEPRIVLIMGARRVGKTTLLLETIRRLLSRGLGEVENLTYLDLDTMNCADVLASPAPHMARRSISSGNRAIL